MLLSVGLAALLPYAILISVSIAFAYRTASGDSYRYVGSQSERYANTIASKLNLLVGQGRSLAAAFSAFAAIPPASRRHAVDAQLRAVIDGQPDLLAAWAQWERGAMGDDPAAFAGGPGGGVPRGPCGSRAMTDKAMLCVDDEAIIVFALKRELKARYAARFVYETALSAEEALTAIGDLEAEGLRLILVISDWLMPGMKGDEFLRPVKTRHPGVRAVLVTGQADGETIDSLLRDGVANYVVLKTWSPSSLFEKIDGCLGDGIETAF
jgi:CheY-like chemotaxis protein